jgi:calcineurin-like phosphoesterase family protein
MEFEAYTSDLHYSHKNIIRYCNRPFVDVEEMREQLIDRYNSVIGHNDRVLFIGDIFFCGFDDAKQIMRRLGGIKYLIRGNHDKNFTDKQLLHLGFEAVYPSYYQTWFGNSRVWYSHYPYAGYSADARYLDRRPPNDDAVIVHGHTHEKTKLTNNNTVHIGVDGWDFRPAMRDEVYPLVLEAAERKRNAVR